MNMYFPSIVMTDNLNSYSFKLQMLLPVNLIKLKLDVGNLKNFWNCKSVTAPFRKFIKSIGMQTQLAFKFSIHSTLNGTYILHPFWVWLKSLEVIV